MLPIDNLSKPIYLGEYSDMPGRYYTKEIYFGIINLKGNIDICGYDYKLLPIVAKVDSKFNITSPYSSVGQNFYGMTIHVGSLTISEVIQKFEEIYSEVFLF